MKDRYLFKAKRLDNREWVIGYLYRLSESNPPFIMLINKKGESYEVNECIICQCTGLKDKNGKLIWENDIAKFDVYYYEKLESSIISQIKWCDNLCALSLVVNDKGIRGTLGHLMDLNKEIEVVGNIFDNPELLENEE